MAETKKQFAPNNTAGVGTAKNGGGDGNRTTYGKQKKLARTTKTHWDDRVAPVKTMSGLLAGSARNSFIIKAGGHIIF